MIEAALAWLGTVAASMLGGLAIYFSVAGYYHYRYYVRRGDHPEAWKLQPKRAVKPGQQRRAILASSRNLAVGGLITGTLVFAMQRGATAFDEPFRLDPAPEEGTDWYAVRGTNDRHRLARCLAVGGVGLASTVLLAALLGVRRRRSG